MKACGRRDAHECPTGAHAPVPRCAHCDAPDVIRGDGGMTLVCPRCVAAMTRIADEPYSVPETVRERLLADALDVTGIELGDWRWTSAWPRTGDLRTLRGVSA